LETTHEEKHKEISAKAALARPAEGIDVLAELAR
jgi:hypothetical protein